MKLDPVRPPFLRELQQAEAGLDQEKTKCYYCRTMRVRMYHLNTYEQVLDGFGRHFDFANSTSCSAVK